MSPAEPEPVLVSACLLGRTCRYDGSHNHDTDLERDLHLAGRRPVPFCPEEEGGLPTPRPPAWLTEGDAEAVLDGTARVVRADGADVTEAFLAGARRALATCRREEIHRAYLKERSPSCGACRTHVDGEPRDGPGVTTALLRRAGITVEGA